jgi:hypothetical protein
MIRLSDRILRLSAASCGESSILNKVIRYSKRSLTPQQAAGNGLTPGFKAMVYGITVTVTWLLTTVYYLLSASH